MIDCVVVGAGPAGLAASAALTARRVEHLVLERGRAGESWRSQRWDSFRLNTVGWMNLLLGDQPRDAYPSGPEVVGRLERLAAACPVREGVAVTRLARPGRRPPGPGGPGPHGRLPQPRPPPGRGGAGRRQRPVRLPDHRGPP